MSDLPPLLPPELPGDAPDADLPPRELPTVPEPGHMPGETPIPAVLQST